MDEDEDSGMMNVSSLLLLSMAGAANGMDGVGDQGAGINAAVLRGGVVGLNRSAGLNTTRDDVMDHPAVQFHIYALYAIIFVVGLLGNVLVVFVVAQNRAMQTVTNCFIANLALSDILLCVLAVPFTPLYFYLNEWIFGKILCHLVVYSQGTSVYVSTLTLTSIAIDRFFVILYPFRPRMQMTTCWITILAIWLVALCATLPYGIFVDLTTVDNRTYCEEKWTYESDRQIFGAVTTVMQFVVPFIIMAIAYTKVSIKLADRSREKAKIRLKSCRGEEADRERSRRTNRMLIAMVTIFGASWLPLNVVNLLNDLYAEPTSWWKYYNLCFFVAHTVAMSSTCYNVFLYAWLNDNFRKELKRILPCFSSSPSGAGPTGGNPTATCGGPMNNTAGGRAMDPAGATTVAGMVAAGAADKEGSDGSGGGAGRANKRSAGRFNGALVGSNEQRVHSSIQDAQSSEFDDGPEISTCVQILLPGDEEEDNDDEEAGRHHRQLVDVATVELATDAVRFIQQPANGVDSSRRESSDPTSSGIALTFADEDTCPRCSTKASFMTFDELADVNNIVVANPSD